MKIDEQFLFFLFAIAIAACNFARAQEAASNSEERAPLTMERVYASGEFGERGVGATWAPTGGAFIKRVPSDETKGGQDIVQETPDGEQTVVVKASELIPRDASDDQARPVSVDSYDLSEDSNLVLIYTRSGRVWRQNTRGDYWILDRQNDVFRKLGGEFAPPSSLQFAKISPDGSRVAYVCQNNIYAEEIVSGKIVQLTFDGDKDIINGTFDWVYEEEFDCRDGFRWSPDGKKIAFWRLDSTREPTFVMLDDVGLSTVTGAARIDVAQSNGDFQINSDENENVEEQRGEARNEVADELLKSYPTLVAFKYPRVGCDNAEVAIGIVTLPELGVDSINVAEDTKFVDFNDSEEFYLPGMDWHKGQGGLVVQKTPRSQRECSTYSIDPETAVPTFLFNESDPDGAWQTVYPIYPLGDGDRFLRVSERDGWRRYYLTSFSNLDQLTPITLENADVVSFVSFDYDANGQTTGVYYYASPENATQRRLYRATLSGENARVELDESSVPDDAKLDVDFGFESWSISADSNWGILRRSAFGVPSCVDLVQLDGNKARVVKRLEANMSLREKLAKEGFGKSEFFKVEIDAKFDFEKDAGTDEKISLDGWIMFPRDWNPDDPKRYPVLVYVYGEPASQTVLDSWGGSTYLYHRAIAERDCVVLSVDGRGTPAPKGRAWRKCVYQKFGAVGRSDQAAALRKIFETFPYAAKLDAERVGVWGWSGGGTSTLNLLFNYPDLYSCGISIAPVPDYRNYDTIYQERYSGLITETPESYQLGSPIGYAGNLQGKLLLIHGSGDDNCHFQTSERLINELIASGKDFETFVYPFRSHGIFEGRGTTLHLRKKTMNFWERNLFAPANSN
ncbi:MAG: DPP IV N-terminal domain-containing protein [Thermoguttaceae bacterium]|nr:DPP IV N-terminal domain-containing protein [Thermoguttaceae bacterium]